MFLDSDQGWPSSHEAAELAERSDNPHGREGDCQVLAANRYVSPRERPLVSREHRIRQIAYALKDSHHWAIDEAARAMGRLVSPGDVLVPIPNRRGSTRANRRLARAIAHRAGVPVCDVLTRRLEVPSSRDLRLAGFAPLSVEAHAMLRMSGCPPGRVVFVDNVLTSAGTATAAARALDVPCVALVWAWHPRIRNPRSYWTHTPGDRIDLVGTPWVDDVSKLVSEVQADPQLSLLVGPAVPALLERARTAPRRRGPAYVKVVRRTVDPVPYEGASEGWYLDRRTGQEVVEESDGSWWLVTPPPPGAFTVGELVRLDHEFEKALERLAQAAEEGFLSQAQRRLAAHNLGDAAEDVELRIAILKLQLDPEEEKRIKRAVLEQLAREDNPGQRGLVRRKAGLLSW